MSFAVQVNDLWKSYGKLEALRGVSFDVRKGELFGIIGPDGAGKSTLLRILASLIPIFSKREGAPCGTVCVEGWDVVKDFKEIRSRVGYMPQRFSLYPDLTVEENLRFFATLHQKSENDNLINPIYQQLEPFSTRLAGKLSGGMKQKLALCCALVHQPSVLFLDEPTTGVDPVSRKEFWDILKQLNAQGITILVSTPYMDEATLCDRIALMRNGSFMQMDTPRNIVSAYPEILWAVWGNPMYHLLQELRRHPKIKSSFAFGNVHHITVQPDLSIEQLRTTLHEKGFTEIEIKPIEPTIEDCYMLLAAQPISFQRGEAI